MKQDHKQIEKEVVAIDMDPSLGYEQNSLLRRFVNVFYIPFLNNIPAGFRTVIKKTNHSARKVIETATTHEAIEVLYNYGEKFRARSLLQKFFQGIWFSTNNPKALRNRRRLVEREIVQAVDRLVEKREPVRLLSIASGSARAVLDALSGFAGQNDAKFSVTFLDKNPKANEYSQKLKHEYTFNDNFDFHWVTDTARNFPEYFKGISQPNVLEMVGLMDYFSDDKIRELFKIIYQNLAKEGTFIVGNISDNPERKFVTNVVGWKMIYRRPADFITAAEAAGFTRSQIKVFYEPLKVHFVMVAKK